MIHSIICGIGAVFMFIDIPILNFVGFGMIVFYVIKWSNLPLDDMFENMMFVSAVGVLAAAWKHFSLALAIIGMLMFLMLLIRSLGDIWKKH
jgi:hypothetical protein